MMSREQAIERLNTISDTMIGMTIPSAAWTKLDDEQSYLVDCIVEGDTLIEEYDIDSHSLSAGDIVVFKVNNTDSNNQNHYHAAEQWTVDSIIGNIVNLRKWVDTEKLQCSYNINDLLGYIDNYNESRRINKEFFANLS